MKDQEQTKTIVTEHCSVRDCDKAADFAVLVCTSEMPAVLGLDPSCPHLCMDHMLVNESKAFGYFQPEGPEEYHRTGHFFPANFSPSDAEEIRTPGMAAHYPFTLKDETTMKDSALELDSFVVYLPLQSHNAVLAGLDERIQARRGRSTGRALV
jgi:hypothetical protein